jgi:peptide/nickel transport system permease protein
MSVVATTVEVPEGRQTRIANETPRLLRRLLRRPIALACLAYLAAICLVAIIAPLAMPWVMHQDAGNVLDSLKGPSGAHLLGTDSLGRDVLERLLVGTRATIVAVLEAEIVSLAISVPVGITAGYFGGPFDRIVGRLVELTQAMPTVVVLLVVLTVFKNDTLAAMVAFGVLASPGTIRLVRGAVLPVREELYVDAARVSGLSNRYIMTRHILPRVTGPIIISASFFAAAALLAQAGLAFLGLLGQPPAPTWGEMINDGIQNIQQQPWLIWPPGIVMALTTIAFGLLGDEVRDATTETWQTSLRRAKKRSLLGPLRVLGAMWFGSLFTKAIAPKHRITNQASPAASAIAGSETEELPGDVPRPVANSRPPGSRPGAVGDNHVDPVTRPAIAGPSSDGALLVLENVSVAFASAHGSTSVIEDVSFELARGETIGIVGESGCGKTMTAMAILGLLPATGRVTHGQIFFEGRDLAALPEKDLRRLRGKEIALVSQEPMVALNPAFRVGAQLEHCLRVHHGISRKAARLRAVELLARVRLPNPRDVARRYPHELSGGMAQRVAIARALSGEPKLLIADEPTTALDVTVQAEILELLRGLARDQGMAILFVTHDWGVVADICDRAVVMYAGQVVERAPISPIFHSPLHPYTQALLSSNPHHAPETEFLATIPGIVPRPGDWPAGCHFQPRCPHATGECSEHPIPLCHPSEERETRCIHYEELVVR